MVTNAEQRRQPPRRTTKPKPSLRRKLVLLAAATAVAVGAAEILLRVAAAWLHPAFYQLDQRLGWRHVANVNRELQDETDRRVRYSTDARGLRRSADATWPPPPDHDIVLVLGDSFTDGSQVELDELFTAHLEQALDRVAVLNAGVGGYSTVQELLLLEQWLAELVPDVVVVAVYQNDFEDNLMPYFAGMGPRPHARVRNGKTELVRDRDPSTFEPFLLPAPGRFWLYQHSAIYRSLQKNLFLPRRGDQLWQREKRQRDALPLADQRLAMADLIELLATATQTAGSELIVANIPTRDEARAGTASSDEWFATTCKRLDVPFVPLIDTLHAGGADTAYFPNDIHFEREGHQLAARALLPAVRAALEQRR